MQDSYFCPGSAAHHYISALRVLTLPDQGIILLVAKIIACRNYGKLCPMKDSTKLPDLRMLPTELLLPHEDSDPRRVEKLSQRIKAEGRLKNPPIVSQIPGSDKYVILDGANRVMAFVTLGIPHMVAQIVSYADTGVELDTWYHVVAGMEFDEFDHALTRITGLDLLECTLEEARFALKTNQAAAYIISEHGVRKACSPTGERLNDVHLLQGIVGAYRGKADIFRASNDNWAIQKPFYPNITALVVFPSYSPADILQTVRNGDKVPSGITRHLIPQRALNINIPLEVLAANWDLERKCIWLDNWLMERMAANAIRYYAESTFSFDE